MLILLQNFRSMCSAATESKYSPDSENWWFLFANFLFREITHFFLDTYLPNGQNIRLSSSDLTSSLALLDKHLFGGVLSFSHDPNLNTCNVSTDTVVLARDQPPRIQADMTPRKSCLY